MGALVAIFGLVLVLAWQPSGQSADRKLVVTVNEPTAQMTDWDRATSTQATRLTLVTVEDSADTAAGVAVVAEAYGRLGVEVDIRGYPAQRAILLASSGEADGEVQRIDSVRELYPSLVQVHPAVNYLEASVFSSKTEFEPNGWDSLDPYCVGIIRGIKFAEAATAGMNRHFIADYPSLFRMLEHDRIDVAVTPRVNGRYHIRSAKLDSISELGEPLARFELYHYLHERHRDLVPRIAAVLEEMRASGDMRAIRDHANKVLMNRARRGSDIYQGGGIDADLYLRPRPRGAQ